MKAIAWPRFLRRQERARPSPLANVLPRVRDLREEREWKPVTPPGTVTRRAGRVTEARRKIVYHPLPPERMPDFKVEKSMSQWLGLALFAVALIGLMIWLAWHLFRTASLTVELVPHQMTYMLPGAPWFLTEDIALEKATKSISYAGLNTNEWKATRKGGKQQTLPPDGSTDVVFWRHVTANPNVGLFIFESANKQMPITVLVQLYFQQVTCSFSVPR